MKLITPAEWAQQNAPRLDKVELHTSRMREVNALKTLGRTDEAERLLRQWEEEKEENKRLRQAEKQARDEATARFVKAYKEYERKWEQADDEDKFIFCNYCYQSSVGRQYWCYVTEYGKWDEEVFAKRLVCRKCAEEHEANYLDNPFK